MPIQRSTLRGARVLFADNDFNVRQDYVLQLEAAGLHVEPCANGVELRNALALYARTFDAVVTDLWDMGTEAGRFVPYRDIPALVKSYAPLPFVLISADIEQPLMYEDAGVRGCVLKVDTARGLLRVLHQILVDDVDHPNPSMRFSASVDVSLRLSRRERQLLRLTACGQSDKEIAKHLALAATSIPVFQRRIRDKLGARDRAEMVAIAVQKGLVYLGARSTSPTSTDTTLL